MRKFLAVSPSNYDGDGDTSPSTSATSVSSTDAMKGSTAAPSLNDCDEKPPSNYVGNGDASTSTYALSESSSIDAIKGSTAALSLNDYADDEEEEDVCRICRNPGDTENPLRFPCACRGSIKYVHQDCLLQWLNHSNARRCEVCEHAFAFSPVYAENAPTKLPFQEFIVEIAKKTCHISHFFLRLSFLLSIVLLIIPFITIFICRLAFVRSFGEVQRLFSSYMSIENILDDYCLGTLLTMTIQITFLGVISLWDYLKSLEQLGGQNGQGIARAGLIEQMLGHAENVPFLELVGLQGPIFPVVKFTFYVLALNIFVIGAIIFVPFCLGRVIVHYLSLKGSCNQYTLGIGYLALSSPGVGFMVLSSPFFFYHLIRKYHFHDLASVRETVCSLLRHLKTMLKSAFIVVIYLVVLPLICGWWINVTTIGLSENSIPQGLEFFTVSSNRRSAFYWSIGIMYLLHTEIFVSLLREVLRKGVRLTYNEFCDLFDVPLHKHVIRFLLAVPLCGCLIIMLVFSPVKLAMWIAPSVFPLDITVSNFAAEVLLYESFISIAIRHFKLPTRMKSVIHYWLTTVGSALGLTDFLFPTPENNGAHERQDKDFVVLLILAWMTLLVINTALIILPVSLGRPFITAISLLPKIKGIEFNDMYAFIMGSYVIWAIVGVIRYLIEHIRTRRVNVLWMNIRKWSLIFVKSCALCVPILGVALVIYRFAWLGCLCLGLVLFYVWFTYVHNSIRDERYLIGRTLHNFGEDKGHEN